MPVVTLILCGDSRREMEEWITALRNVTLRNSNVCSYFKDALMRDVTVTR